MTHNPKYKVDQLRHVTKQVRELEKKAIAADSLTEFIGALESMVHELELDPLAWGDPEYHPIKKGSLVCHRVCPPLFVRYVIFEEEQIVTVLDVKPLPNSALD